MIVFGDSFDHYTVLLEKWDITSSNVSIQSSAARNGIGGLRVSNSVFNSYVQKNIPSQPTYFVGFAFQVNVNSTGQVAVCAFNDTNSNQVELRLNTTGTMQFYRNGNALGSPAGLLSNNIWHYMEVKVTISPTVGIVELKVDGNFIIQLSGQNTQTSPNAAASAFILGCFDIFPSGGYQGFYDDVVIMDTTGSYNNGYIGDVKLQCVMPDANGTQNNFSQAANGWIASTVYVAGTQIIDSNGNLQRVTTAGTSKSGTHPVWASSTAGGSNTTIDNTVTWTCEALAPLINYQFVNELPTPDDNSSYVLDGTVNDQERYSFVNVSGASVYAAIMTMRVEKDDSGARSIRAVADSGGIVVDSGTDLPLPETTYAFFQGVFETDPNTSTPWTIAGVNAAEFGLKITV